MRVSLPRIFSKQPVRNTLRSLRSRWRNLDNLFSFGCGNNTNDEVRFGNSHIGGLSFSHLKCKLSYCWGIWMLSESFGSLTAVHKRLDSLAAIRLSLAIQRLVTDMASFI